MSHETAEAIIDATTALLAERRLSEFSLEDVAARAHVSKASIYRRWPSKGTLAFEAFMVQFTGTQPEPGTGRLEDDLLVALRNWIRTVDGTPTGRTLRGLVGEVQRDPELAEAWRERFIVRVRDRIRVIAEQAIARGELREGADTDLLLDLLYGPAYHRLLQGHLGLDERFVTGVVGVIMAAVREGAI